MLEKYTFQDMSDFINAQDDDQPINMNESANEYKETGFCGCLLYQFTKNKGFDGDITCGLENVYVKNKDLTYTDLIFDLKTRKLIIKMLHTNATTFKDAKYYLSNI